MPVKRIASGSVPAQSQSPIELHRTFRRARGDETGDEPDMWQGFSDEPRYEWSTLHARTQRTVVVIGEAGVGKTEEMKLEVKRLRDAGHAAFFVELNLLVAMEDWNREVGAAAGYSAWQASDGVAHFFLDAVDEARLANAASLARSLAVARAALADRLHRVRIVLSSRISDWALPDVRKVVEEKLAGPLQRETPSSESGSATESLDALYFDCESSDGDTLRSMFVVRLETLDQAEARRFAAHIGLANEKEFWETVDSGAYRFMAGRPLDLDWLVRRWNSEGRLGELLELLEGNVENRLNEFNPSHRDSDWHLPRRHLIAGAQRLAAAEVFEGSALVTSACAYPVLDDWSERSVHHLLGTALFDEATYGRVKFHHRTVREYLAACWVERRLLATGVSLPHVMALFESHPFGEPVLIPSRRWTLCWLAAMNPRVREWLARLHPEMVVFDGDPMAWDESTADAAFAGYVQKMEGGYKPDWFNSADELGRVGRRLPPGRLASLLRDRGLSDRVRHKLIGFAFHARLTDCSSAMFEMFTDAGYDDITRALALQALTELGTPEQRSEVADALQRGDLCGNAMVAAGLRVAGLRFSLDHLRAILLRTGDEAAFGLGAVASAISKNLLPTAQWPEVSVLLEAVLDVMPAFDSVNKLPRRVDGRPPKRAWTLEVLPGLCLAALEKMPDVSASEVQQEKEVLLRALVALQSLRDTDYGEPRRIDAVSRVIERRTDLRWALAYRFFERQELEFSITWMTGGRGRSLVFFEETDLDDLTERANAALGDGLARRKLFFLAHDLAWKACASPRRLTALRRLICGPDAGDRRSHIATQLGKFRSYRRQKREHERLETARRAERAAEIQAVREAALKRIDGLRAGTDLGALAHLVLHSRLEPKSSSAPERVAAIGRELGEDVATAVSEGLGSLWAGSAVPNPRDRVDGRRPEIVALLDVAWGLVRRDHTMLDAASIRRAARLAVWSSEDRPPRWLADLVSTSPEGVVEALSPWLVSDAASISKAPAGLDTLNMVVHARAEIRRVLLEPLRQRAVDGEFGRALVWRRVLGAMHKEALVSLEEVGVVISRELGRCGGDAWGDEQSEWLRLWLSVDIARAWDWLAANLQAGSPAWEHVWACIYKVSGDLGKQSRADAATARVLSQIYESILVGRHVAKSDESAVWQQAQSESALQALAGALAEIPGVRVAHEALRKLALADPAREEWLRHLSERQAGLSAEAHADVPFAELRALEETFASPAVEPGRLYQQVIARLEDLRLSIEEGPYSEAVLFEPGMDKSKLQVWLAARLAGSGNRRFSVTREEELHLKNRPDVQVGCAGGKVCIEVKPLDGTRYSAAELVRTLSDQLVEQYLVGLNSRHGILMLILLQKRSWRVPGKRGLRGLADLVKYLQHEANGIAARRGDIEKLQVFAIDASALPVKATRQCRHGCGASTG